MNFDEKRFKKSVARIVITFTILVVAATAVFALFAGLDSFAPREVTLRALWFAVPLTITDAFLWDAVGTLALFGFTALATIGAASASGRKSWILIAVIGAGVSAYQIFLFGDLGLIPLLSFAGGVTAQLSSDNRSSLSLGHISDDVAELIIVSCLILSASFGLVTALRFGPAIGAAAGIVSFMVMLLGLFVEFALYKVVLPFLDGVRGLVGRGIRWLTAKPAIQGTKKHGGSQ